MRITTRGTFAKILRIYSQYDQPDRTYYQWGIIGNGTLRQRVCYRKDIRKITFIFRAPARL